jgi:hypothetical protein
MVHGIGSEALSGKRNCVEKRTYDSKKLTAAAPSNRFFTILGVFVHTAALGCKDE